MKSPVTTAEEAIKTCDTVLDICNSLMVAHIRIQVYRDKMAQGWKPDSQASQFMHTMAHLGTQEAIDNTRQSIVNALTERRDAITVRDVVLDAVHKAQHEVLGECMYAIDWDDETKTEILSQPCPIWKDAPVKKTYA